MLSFETTLVIAALVGLFIGFVIRNLAVGCISLLIVPVAMIAYVEWVHANMDGRLNSTSALDYLFGPLWPTLAALAAFVVGVALREIRR